MTPPLKLFAVVLTALATGCHVGPDYERPEYPVPEAFRGAQVPPADVDLQGPTYGTLQWFDVYDDPVLQELIKQALKSNYDVRLAAERVIQARALVTISRSDLYPELNAGGTYSRTRATENGAVPIPQGVDEEQSQWSLFGDLSWDLDFWGRFASASEAARADLLATEFARLTVIQTLVSDVALAYFDLLQYDQVLQITRRTHESRVKSLELVSLRLDEGVASKLEYRQSEGIVLQSAAFLPRIELAIERQENLIRFLIGGNPGPVPRGRPLLEQKRTIDVPLGLPSDLLTRRPDLMAAEQGLIAANARIGEAKALLYPSIRLTGLGGVASEDLSDLFKSGSRIWDIAPSVTLPIFNAGRLRSNVVVTESQQRQAALSYLQSVQIAFREVSDALVEHEKREEVREWQEKLEKALADQLSLSNDRYLGGVTSYLEVLDSQRDHFSAELALVESIRDELFSSVVLYRALGGGWLGTEELAAQGEQVGASVVPPSSGG